MISGDGCFVLFVIEPAVGTYWVGRKEKTILILRLCFAVNMSESYANIVKVGSLLVGGLFVGYVAKKLLEKKEKKDQKERYFVGIDLGATNAKVGVVNDNGELISVVSEPLSDYSDMGVVKSLIDVGSKAISEVGLEWNDICEIGVGSPGTIDFDVSTCWMPIF